MAVNIGRYYGRGKWEFDCEVITPMFLGGANQEAELRAAPFKGLLRYWWRVANGREAAGHAALLSRENRIFGSADEKSGGRSRVTIRVEPVSGMTPSKNDFGNPGNVVHGELKGKKTNPLNYLAGMGLIHGGIQYSYFPTGGRFRLTIESAADVASEVGTALELFTAFAAIGSRCRNGWGSLALAGGELASPVIVDWQKAMDRDYPNCLGRDGKGLLLWQTRQIRGGWKECMKDLADSYIKTRTGLNVVSGNPPDRHLLGYPVTHHSVNKNNWGHQGRHASALRLFVRREGDGHRGYVLHLPHLFSDKMWPNDKQRQIKIWQKVHQSLDQTCERVAIEEVLP